MFSGYTWTVKTGVGVAPGPNNFAANNVSVDTDGYLHLWLKRAFGSWSCSEVYSTESFGFGTYEFLVKGPLGKLDQNVTLGLFSYLGPDATNEIDIEYSQFGQPSAKSLNYTVWPSTKIPGYQNEGASFEVGPYVVQTYNRFIWTPSGVSFASIETASKDLPAVAVWLGKRNMSQSPSSHIPQQAMPVHLNLYLHNGTPPTYRNQNDVDIVITSFQFTPST